MFVMLVIVDCIWRLACAYLCHQCSVLDWRLRWIRWKISANKSSVADSFLT